MYFLDGHNHLGTYTYRILAVDFWGRESIPSDSASVDIVSPVPPAPVNVHAKYLDYTTLAGSKSSDPNLTQNEIDWLVANGISSICVDWQWTPGQDGVCADVDDFVVHFQHGWLNQYRGVVSTDYVEEVLLASDLNFGNYILNKYPALDGAANYDSYKIEVQLDTTVAKDDLRMAWFKQGGNSFLVLKNSAGSNPEVWLLVPLPAVGGEPVNGKAFVLSLAFNSPAFKDYTDVANWTDTSVTATVAFTSHISDIDGVKTYRTYISSPAFPSPAFVANEQKPMRYAQMAVSATNTDGVIGAVSAPSPIFAVHRAAPDALDTTFIDYGTAMATAPDVHGKSTFYYRWQKQGIGMKYFVYRAMDSSIVRVDLAAGHLKTDYENLADSYSIAYDDDTFDLTSVADYDVLDSNQLFVVSNMVGNEEAFTVLHSEPIAEDDGAYANRNTRTPAIGDPEPPIDSNYLLFEDAGLDGRGNNTYFYRIRPVGRAGSLSD